MTTHRLKVLIKYADAIMNGTKTFEVRKNDRGYEVGDKIVFDVVTNEGYSIGEAARHPLNGATYRIDYILDDFEGLATCLDLVDHKQDPFIPGKRMVDGYFHCSDCGWDGRIWEHIGFGGMLAYEAVHCPKCGAIIKRCE